MTFIILLPLFGDGRVGDVRLVEYHQTRLVTDDFFNLRVAAAFWNPCIPQLHNDVHQSQAFLHHPAGLCHVSREPLDARGLGQVFLFLLHLFLVVLHTLSFLHRSFDSF